MDPTGQSGQSTLEWLALMAMCVAIAGLLVTTIPSIGDVITRTVSHLISQVAGG